MSADPFEAFIAQLDLSDIPGSDDPLDEEELEQRDRLARVMEILEGDELEHLPDCTPADLEIWTTAADRTMRQYQIRFEADSHNADEPRYLLTRQRFHMLMMTCIAMAVGRADPNAMDLAADTVRVAVAGGLNQPEDQFESGVPALLSAMKKACYVYTQLWPQPPAIE